MRCWHLYTVVSYCLSAQNQQLKRDKLYHSAGTGWVFPGASGSIVASGDCAVFWLLFWARADCLAPRRCFLFVDWPWVACGEASTWFEVCFRPRNGKLPQPVTAPTRAAATTILIINRIDWFIPGSNKEFCSLQSEKIIQLYLYLYWFSRCLLQVMEIPPLKVEPIFALSWLHRMFFNSKLKKNTYHSAGTGSLESDCPDWLFPVVFVSTVVFWACRLLVPVAEVLRAWLVDCLALRACFRAVVWPCVPSWAVPIWFKLRPPCPRKGKRQPIAAPARAATATTMIIKPINLFIPGSNSRMVNWSTWTNS